jgi:hypothetical protein
LALSAVLSALRSCVSLSSADGKLSASASSSSSNAVGATVGFAAAGGLFAAAGVVVYLKNRNTAAKQEDAKLTEANLEAL